MDEHRRKANDAAVVRVSREPKPTTTALGFTTTTSTREDPNAQNGKDAESVKAGTYTLKVEDKSDAHNFHLIGPGVDKVVTDVGFVGDKTVTVTLKKGTYTYQCDPHASSGMKGTFEVT